MVHAITCGCNSIQEYFILKSMALFILIGNFDEYFVFIIPLLGIIATLCILSC